MIVACLLVGSLPSGEWLNNLNVLGPGQTPYLSSVDCILTPRPIQTQTGDLNRVKRRTQVDNKKETQLI